MGYPFFSWRDYGGDREQITLSEDLSDLQITSKRDIVDSYSIGGGRSRQNLRPWVEVRIVLDRFTDRKLFLNFRGMLNHLERGGTVAFGNDHEKAFIAPVVGRKFQGNSQHRVGLNLGAEYSTGTTSTTVFDIGDEIVIESGAPHAKRNHAVVSHDASYSADEYLIQTTGYHLYTDYPEGATWVRHHDFFPTCVLPTGAVGTAMLSHDHRITYTLDMTLIYILPRLTIDQTTSAESSQPTDDSGGGNTTDKPDWDSWSGGSDSGTFGGSGYGGS